MTLSELITRDMQQTGRSFYTLEDVLRLAAEWRDIKAAAATEAELDLKLFGRPLEEVLSHE
jgi:hypothetical protein